MKTYAIVASLFPPHVGGVERYSYNLAKKWKQSNCNYVWSREGKRRRWNKSILSSFFFAFKW